MQVALALLLSSAWGAAAVPRTPRSTASSLLNSSYVQVAFGQDRASIEAYSENTLRFLSEQSWRPFGYLKNGVPALAQWDNYHRTTTFATYVTQQNDLYVNHPGPCHDYWNTSMVNNFNDYPSWTALGVLEQYAAYGGDDLVDQVQQEFDFITAHGFISEADLQAGYLKGTKPSYNKLQPSCDGKSMLGGVYWENGCPGNAAASNDSNIPTVSTALYALVGASLCRMTSNDTYCHQAYQSLQWIDRILRRPDGLIGDQINGSTCEIKNWQPFTYNSALYIAAYADLGNYKSDSNALALARSTAIASMNTPVWNDRRGILTEGVGSDLASQNFIISFGPTLIRFLQRSYGFFDAELQQAILQYINIQYWALTQLDSDSQTRPLRYGRNWTGPGYDIATNYSIAQATYVLNAISLNSDSSFPPTTNASAPVASLVSAGH